MEEELLKYRDTRPTATERSNFSGAYSIPLIKEIIAISKEQGVDPYEMLALGLQETRFGQAAEIGAPDKRGRVYNLESTPFPQETLDRISGKWDIEAGTLGFVPADRREAARLATQMLKRKEVIARSRFGPDPERYKVLQAWQGYGYSPLKSSFGGQRNLKGDVHFPHGKRIIEHMESLKRSPGITELLMRP